MPFDRVIPIARMEKNDGRFSVKVLEVKCSRAFLERLVGDYSREHRIAISALWAALDRGELRGTGVEGFLLCIRHLDAEKRRSTTP
jgi:hypothetical protein